MISSDPIEGLKILRPVSQIPNYHSTMSITNAASRTHMTCHLQSHIIANVPSVKLQTSFQDAPCQHHFFPPSTAFSPHMSWNFMCGGGTAKFLPYYIHCYIRNIPLANRQTCSTSNCFVLTRWLWEHKIQYQKIM